MLTRHEMAQEYLYCGRATHCHLPSSNLCLGYLSILILHTCLAILLETASSHKQSQKEDRRMGKKKRTRAAPPKKAGRSKFFPCPVCNTIESVGSERISKEGVFVLTCKMCKERYTYKYGLLDTPNEAHRSWGDFIYKKKKYGVPCPGFGDCKCNFKGIAIIDFFTERDEGTGIENYYARLTCGECGTSIRPLYTNETKAEFKKRMEQEHARGRDERRKRENDDNYDARLVSPEAPVNDYNDYKGDASKKRPRNRGDSSHRKESSSSDILDDDQEIASQISEPRSEDDI